MAALKPWLRTIALGILGGVMGAIYTVIVEPDSFHFPHDLGSGKMWKFFVGGMILTISGVLVESPLGKKLMHPFERVEREGERKRPAK